MYFSEICTSADSIHDVLKILTKLMSILGFAELELKKWSWNTTAVLEAVEAIPINNQKSSVWTFDNEEDSGTKVFGLQWHPGDDYIRFTLRDDSSVTYIKRGLLSLIARIFNPLGLFATTTLHSKGIMWRIWLAKMYNTPGKYMIQKLET